MKKIYTVLFIAVFFTGCSKDILESYDEKIIGSWTLTDVDLRGIGGDKDKLPFLAGNFLFEEGGKLTYTDLLGAQYDGSWDVDVDYTSTGGYADENGNVINSQARLLTLDITAIDFTSQEVRSEHFQEIRFNGSNKFKAFIRYGMHTYVFFFERD